MSTEPGPETFDAANAADVAEQRAELDGGVLDGAADRDDLPLEADPADVVEQDRAVPYDDDER